MNLKQAALSARSLATRLDAKAQDVRALDNNKTFDDDPRDNFVSVKSEDWSYQGEYDKQGNTLKFYAATHEKYEADGTDDVPAQTMSIETAGNGDKSYEETALVTHPGCMEYFREDSTKAVIDKSGEALVYDKVNYGNSPAFLA